MEFLTQCPSVKIEDILPFFPDFVTIDHFKSAIVESLQDYSKHITDLKVSRKYISYVVTRHLCKTIHRGMYNIPIGIGYISPSSLLRRKIITLGMGK